MKRRLWTMDDDAIMRAEYPNISTKKLAEKLGVSIRSCYSRATVLGLVKTSVYLSTPESGRLSKGDVIGSKTFFKKGNKPFNKGLKIEDFMSKESIEKTKSTRFKKGQAPHNTKEDGVIVSRKDKCGKTYLYIRESLGVWKLYQRHIWEQHHEKLKNNEVVRFRDGNTLNCEISNLIMVPKSENMKLNTIHQYPEDLKQVIKLTNKLKKQIIKTRNNG
ncbi:HNH nuclease [uncultured Caudovirales phage]|uniref:HNH nuclease n=1 Tax=uncultured Caudovirales phage TaxID=2100421 RepID=A0A6J5L3H2_9CAUD|nr:HNH nuclease [uncultured Caudovirales phage]